MRALVFALALCACSVAAQDAPDPRARLAQLIEREQHLLDLLRRVREGSGVNAGELLTPLPPVARRATHEDPESAFARAQLADEAPLKPHAPGQPEVSAIDSQTVPAPEPATVTIPPLPAEHTDPQRLGDAYLIDGQAVAALDAYERAAERAEAHGTPVEVARARYGVARALEALEQFDASLEAYAAVEKLPEAGLWAQASSFARTFIRWRRQVAAPSLQQKDSR